MEFIFELILQFLGEILLQVIIECLVEIGFHGLADAFKRPKDFVLSTVGFIVWGALAGWISLVILPKSFIADPVLRKANIVITPLVAGTVMMAIGKQRGKRGQSLVKLDRFGYAFVFAFTMALVRYAWAA